MKDYGTFFKKKNLVGFLGKEFLHMCAYPHIACKVRVMNEHLPLCLCPHIRVLDLLKKVLRSSSHPHLLDDLLIEKRSFILQFTAACLCKWITSLSEKEKEKEINNSSHGFCGKGSSLTANLK